MRRLKSILLAGLVVAAGVFTATPAVADVSYANCDAVRAAGAAPLFRGQPGYSRSLDRDGDGVACETGGSGTTPPPATTTPPPPPASVAQTDIVKYSWSPNLYSVTFYSTGWVWHKLTGAEWANTGYRAPRLAGWIEGTVIFKYQVSGEIFATLDGYSHKLTFAEWQDMGLRAPLEKRGGYVKLWWAPQGIAITDGVTSSAVTYDAWAAAQFPTPQALGILPGDRICAAPGSADLVFQGATLQNHRLTYGEWDATGYRQPSC
jgi:hypothetical protein